MTAASTSPARTGKSYYTVNRRLLLVSVAVVVVAALAGYGWYQYQRGQAATALLSRADQLQAEGDQLEGEGERGKAVGKWNAAATYYQRYLLAEPENTEVLVQLVNVAAKDETDPGKLLRNGLLYRVLGRLPERADLRKLLAENLLKTGAFAEAAIEAEKLLEGPPELARAARKVIAISRIQRAEVDHTISLPETLEQLVAAAKESPADHELALVTATSLREHLTELPPSIGDPATLADQILDQAVAAAPDQVAPRMARYRYRLRYALPGAEEDLAAALQADPDHVDALLSSAIGKLAGSSPPAELQAAATQLRRVIELAPTDIRGYLALAEALKQQDQAADAIQLLRDALRATDNHFELELALGTLQLQSEQIDEASATLNRLEAQSPAFFATQSRERRNQLENRLRLLAARIDLIEGQPAAAIAALKAIHLAEESASALEVSAEWTEAAQLLAAIHDQRREWDQAARYWEGLLRVIPGNAELVSAAAGSALNGGNARQAIEIIDRLQRTAAAPPDLLVRSVQAQLILQLQRAPEQRNWSEFQAALATAQAQAPERWELVVAELEYLRTQPEADRKSRALLRSAEEKFKDRKEFWRNAALQYARLKAPEDRQRAVGRYQELESSPVQKTLLEATLLTLDQQYAAADKLLARVAKSLPAAERGALERRRLEGLAQRGEWQPALALAKELLADKSAQPAGAKPAGASPADASPADASPEVNHPELANPELLELGAEVALAAGEPALALQWEAQLAAATANGLAARTLKIKRLLGNYPALSPEERQQLGEAVASVRSERPQWSEIVALAARLAELQGDLRRAADDYRLAVELGDRRPFTLQQLVTLLYRLKAVDEADRYLALLAVDPSATAFVNVMESEIALQQGRPAEAIQLAQANVEQFPNDGARRLYLANLVLGSGDRKESEAVLRQAVEDLPNDPGLWMGLVSFLAKDNRRAEAAEILQTIENSGALAVAERAALLAQGYESIGDLTAAAQNYQLALQQDPSNVPLRLRLARLLAPRAIREAQREYDRVLQLDATNPDARRELAVILASTGAPADWSRASQLLEALGSNSGGDASTNDRLRALLLAQQGRTRQERIAKCQAARKILENQLQTVPPQEADPAHLLLAQILEQEAGLSKDPTLLVAARDQLRAVVDGPAPTAETLSRSIEFLLRNAAKVDQVAAPPAEPPSAPASDDDEPLRRKEEFLAAAKDQLAVLKRFQGEGDLGVEALVTALTAQLLQARGESAEATAVIEQFAAQQPANPSEQELAQRSLAIGRLYTMLNDHAAAETWYRQLLPLNPNAYVLVVQALLAQDKRDAAVQLCLERSPTGLSPEEAQTLAGILTSAGDEKLAESAAAEAALAAALQTHPTNGELLQAEAIRRASRGEYDAAITAFTRVTELDPQNSLALNNLATLLAEKPNRRAEALNYIQRAIELAGRQPSLLDTEGTILFKMGQAEQAIASLEEATAGGTADARYYLHLAAAYQLAKRPADARLMLSEARAFGLENFLLTDDDRQLLEELQSALESSPPLTGSPR